MVVVSSWYPNVPQCDREHDRVDEHGHRVVHHEMFPHVVGKTRYRCDKYANDCLVKKSLRGFHNCATRACVTLVMNFLSRPVTTRHYPTLHYLSLHASRNAHPCGKEGAPLLVATPTAESFEEVACPGS